MEHAPFVFCHTNQYVFLKNSKKKKRTRKRILKLLKRPILFNVCLIVLSVLISIVSSTYLAPSKSFAQVSTHALPPKASTTATYSGVNAHPSFSPTKPSNQAHTEPHTIVANPAKLEINLMGIETRRQIFSPILLSPDRRHMAFSDVYYYPRTEQVVSGLYEQPLPAPPSLADTHQLPDEYYTQLARDAMARQKEARAKWWPMWPFRKKKQPVPFSLNPMFDPLQPNGQRTQVYHVGQQRHMHRQFETLTPIDWSANGQHLLFKHKEGKLYDGLRVTHILVHHLNALPTALPTAAPTDIFPQLQQAIEYYWTREGIIPPMDSLDWDITPLGWVPGSNTEVDVKAWAYTPQNRIFLGQWRIDITTGEPRLMNLMDQPVTVGANGAFIAIPNPSPS